MTAPKALRALEYKIADSETDILVTLDLASLYPQAEALLAATRLKTLIVGEFAEMALSPAPVKAHMTGAGMLAQVKRAGPVVVTPGHRECARRYARIARVGAELEAYDEARPRTFDAQHQRCQALEAGIGAVPHSGDTGFALRASRLSWAIGCNKVSLHDAIVSVRAGFAGQELSALWPSPDRFDLDEHAARLFTHCFVARRR